MADEFPPYEPPSELTTTLKRSMKLVQPTSGAFAGANGTIVNPALKKLLDRPPTLSDDATQRLDGRRIPVVLAFVRDPQGRTQPGMLVRLLQGDRLIDQSRTNPRGVALLRFPFPVEIPNKPRPASEGILEVLAPGMDALKKPVSIPGDRQHGVVELVVQKLPDLPNMGNTLNNAIAGGEDAVQKVMDELRKRLRRLGLGVEFQDNPLDRLPADFSTELCADVTKLLGSTEDPILSLAGEAGDFRRRRVPIIKRVTVPRLGLNPAGDNAPPRRYLVRLRQQWTFIGYTLGEIANVEGLDPGSIVNETLESVQKLTEKVARTVESVSSQALESTSSFLNQGTSIDALLQVATSVRATAAAGGFMLPGIGGFGAATASLSTNASTRTRVNTSLQVNSGLQAAKTLVNEALRTSMSTLRNLETTVTKALGQISPLLSRVTNLLRWTLYENYMVCTHVEDVVEIQSVPITSSLGLEEAVLFSDEDIAEYRRIFEPLLLEPKLKPHFELLRRAVAARRAATMPASTAYLSFEYASFMAGADLKITINGQTRVITLRPGGTRAQETIQFLVPIPMPLASAPSGLKIELSLDIRPELIRLPPFLANFTNVTMPVASVSVSRMHVRLESAPGYALENDHHFGNGFRVTSKDGETSDSVTGGVEVRVPAPAVRTESDPLFIHVNRNRHYYFGLLAQAALADPSLRDDAPQLSVFNGNHDLWRLPIIGFEGNRALVIGDADDTIPEVLNDLNLFRNDPGAATVIQIAAPGAYSEALQGLLSLTDAVGKLHPNLLQAAPTMLAPVMPVASLAGGGPLAGAPAAGGTPALPSLPTGGGATPGGGLLGGIL